MSLKTFMGQPATVVEKEIKDSDKKVIGKTTVVKVGKKDFEKIQDSLGVTKEVRTVMSEARETLAAEAAKLLGPEVAKSGNDYKLVLGSGTVGTEIKVEAEVETRNPKSETGEKTKSFGRTTYTERHKNVLKGKIVAPIVEKMKADIEKASKSW